MGSAWINPSCLLWNKAGLPCDLAELRGGAGLLFGGVLTVPVGVGGGGTWLCGAVKFGELGGRCCNLCAQEKGEKDNQWERGGGQLKRFPLLGIGCFYRCPPIVRASLTGLLVDQVAWVPLVKSTRITSDTPKQLASAAQEPAIRSRCDAASNARALDGYTRRIMHHSSLNRGIWHHCGRGPFVCK